MSSASSGTWLYRLTDKLGSFSVSTCVHVHIVVKHLQSFGAAERLKMVMNVNNLNIRLLPKITQKATSNGWMTPH